jgi:hypothetical protein
MHKIKFKFKTKVTADHTQFSWFVIPDLWFIIFIFQEHVIFPMDS